MNKTSTIPQTQTALFIKPTWLFWVMLVLVIAGIGVSSYLLWGYTAPGATVACGGSGGCEAVKNSPFASIFGVSMPAIGLLSYLTLLVLMVAQQTTVVRNRGWGPYTALAIFGFSLIGVLFSAYLTYLELFVIHAICRWCVASAVIISTIFVLSMLNISRVNQQS